MSARFNSGDEVRLISQPDRAGSIKSEGKLSQGEYWYTVHFGPGDSGRHPETDLEPYLLSTDVKQILLDGRFAGKEAFSKVLTQAKLSTDLRSHIYALQASRTTFYAYQFKPVLKFLDSWKQRLLIADEVGLGKTIEAGLILTELRARLDMQRILIVSPSHLITKWQDEMRKRFDLEFRVLDRKGILGFLDQFEKEEDETPLRGIVSLQTLRGRRIQQRWEEVDPHLDLAIFDEAGRLRNYRTLSNRVARLVRDGSDGLLLLTATPIQTSEQDLFNLLSLLDPDEFDNYELYRIRLEANTYVLQSLSKLRGGTAEALQAATETLSKVRSTSYGSKLQNTPMYQFVMQRLSNIENPTRRDLVTLQSEINSLNLFSHVLSRTRRREVEEERAERCPRTISCDPSELEKAFYWEVTRRCRTAYMKAGSNGIAAFVTMMPQRQMASCMPAMVDHYLQRLAVEEFTLDAEDADIRTDDFEVSDPEKQPICFNWLNPEYMQSIRIDLEKVDCKWHKLETIIQTLLKEDKLRKIIVFSYFKRTLAYLERRFAAINVATVLISGDVPSRPDDPDKDERGKRLDRFRDDPKCNILLSTEVGNEGLDLQFAHVLVNYDLPWNPTVVEQRIGRLDRIGQKSKKILIFNFNMPGTIEDTMLDRLYERIEIFKNSIGDIEEILGEVIRDLTHAIFSTDLGPDEIAARIEQVALVVERRRKDLEELESRATSLIGHDEFVLDEINKARQSRRYITGDELLLFIDEFLQSHFPKCSLGPGEKLNTYLLKIDEHLRLFLRQRIPAEDFGLRSFLVRAGRGAALITTDPGIAQDNSRIDFLTFHHPIIRAAVDYYNQHQQELHPVSFLRLRSNAFPEGHYMWLLVETQITGVSTFKELDCVALNIDNSELLHPDAAEELLWKLTSDGESVPAGERHGGQCTGDMADLAEDHAIARLNARYEERRTLNSALADTRLLTLTESFQRNLKIRQERLTTSQMRRRSEKTIRLMQGAIDKLEARFKERRLDVERNRHLGKAIKLKAGGMVEVKHE